LHVSIICIVKRKKNLNWANLARY